MKYIIPIIFFITFLFYEPGCKSTVADIIDCTIETSLLSVKYDIDESNSKLVHFEFVNDDTDGKFTLDQDIQWDFGDGNTLTSDGLKIDHIYADTGSFKVKANFTLRRGDANCTSYKEKDITIQ